MPSILDSLDEQQRAAASCVSGPVVILAGAGTGKTRTITHRLAHAISSRTVDASHTLTVAFTTRAAGEIRSRLAELGVTDASVRTFHSAALRQLRFFYPQVFAGNMPTLITSKSMYVAQASALCHGPRDTSALSDLASEIEWAKVNIMSPQAYREHASSFGRTIGHDLSTDEVARIYETYLKVLDEARCLDFEDVLLMATALLENFPELAAAVHKQYRYFTVDEFQDVSPVQFELLRLWVGNRDDVCVVGDPAQTIYSFTGASSKYLLGFKQYYPRTQEFELTQSYRSTPEILSVANKILARDNADSLRLQATKKSGEPVSIEQFKDDDDEAKHVVAQIRELRNRGVQARDIAVLYRSNFQSEPIEEQLSRENIWYTVRGAARFFERIEIRNAVLQLRAGASAIQDQSLPQVVRDLLTNVGWTPRPPEAGNATRETWQSLNTLVELADEFATAQPTGRLPDFISYLDHRSEHELEPQSNAVTLASIHAAKGLEWDYVFVVGLSDGLLPSSYAQSATMVSEERRLFFVAVTRAKKQLSLSWAMARRNTANNRTKSLFLSELERS